MKKDKIAIIGLGYVGLPLAIEFGKQYECFGFDINKNRIDELNKFIDRTNELTSEEIKKSKLLNFTYSIKDLEHCNIYIITVPTPIDKYNNPDINFLIKASKNVGRLLNKNDIVIYESTVYPGCTEEECVPVLEKESNLIFNKDFFCGYSPERINPGDKVNTLTKIVKVTSGSNKETAKKIDDLYNSIINAGTHLASSIKVAEASKIIENCQRDINIAFANELSILFNLLEIDTNEALDAANTKWNFMDFRPGLVGGHCISIDPYYLTYKSKQLGYDSKIILAGRKLNNSMPKFICNRIINSLENQNLSDANILILGITFKENCSDIRNSKVLEICKILKNQKYNIDVHDPYVDSSEKELSDINLVKNNHIKLNFYDVIIIAVAHNEFKKIKLDNYIKSKSSIIFDLKGFYNNKKYMRL